MQQTVGEIYTSNNIIIEQTQIIKNGLDKVELNEISGPDVARAMMTTDTKPKEIAVKLEINGKTITIGGVAKGSGMIHPNMATMLAFITYMSPMLSILFG